MEANKLIELPDLSKEVKKKVIIHHPFIKKKPDSFLDLYRIEFDEELTRIDFIGYPDTKKYDYGWWITIDRDSFIRPVGSEIKLKLVQAIGIPISPIKYYFISSKHCLPYTLYFPALPKDTTHIDIIEKEIPYQNYFNFYNVSLERVKRKPIIVGN